MKVTSSPTAIDVVTNGRDYMRAKIVGPSGQHELSWYQKVEGGTWKHKRRPLTDEEAVVMQKAIEGLVGEGTGKTPDAVYEVMGLDRGTPVEIVQLTMVDKSKL